MRSTPSSLTGRAAAALLFVWLLAGGTAWGAADLTVTIPLDVPFVNQPITVDGVLGEPAWQQASVLELPLILYRDATEASDLSGTARVFWSDSGLYFGVMVTDDELHFTDDPTKLQDFDSVEAWIGSFWIQIAPGEAGPVIRSRFVNGFPRFEHDIRAAATRTDNGYSVEFVVSKATIEAFAENPLSRGSQHRIAVGLRDRDTEGEKAQPVLYFPDRFGWNNPVSMALATLR